MNPVNSRLEQPAQHAQPKPSAKTLSWIALAFWLVSLALTSLVLYHDLMPGYRILMLGWLAPIFGNFAWFANPLFLWSIYRIEAKKPVVAITLASAFLALDAFLLDGIPRDASSLTGSVVYGYGWGAIMWLAALCILVAAAGTRELEHRLEAGGAKTIREWLRPVGFGLCVSMFMATGCLALWDRSHANNDELKRLSGLAFKRTAVCSIQEPSVTRPLRHDSGALEVRFASGVNGKPNDLTFASVQNLLQWGIPVVRFGDRDYAYAPAGEGLILTSVPALANAAAVLVVSDLYLYDRREVRAKLVEQATQRTVFDQVWLEEIARTDRFCPDYTTTFPAPGQQPRKLVTEALSVQRPLEGDAAKVAHPGRFNLQTVSGQVLSIADPIQHKGQDSQQPSGRSIYESNGIDAQNPWRSNRNCPENVGWYVSASAKSTGVKDIGLPFMIGDKAFYPESDAQRYNALCAGDHAYFYSGAAEGGKYYFSVERRGLPDFKQAWVAIVAIEGMPFTDKTGVVLNAVDEGPDGLILNLLQEKTGRIVVVKVPLQLAH